MEIGFTKVTKTSTGAASAPASLELATVHWNYPMSVKSFEDLVAWQKSVEFVICIYDVTRSFPADERYGITSQLRRAAVSIPSNIAEGQSRRTQGEFMQFLSCASGSLAECQTQLFIAERLSYLSQAEREGLIESTREIGRLIGGLMKSLERGR